MFLRKLSESKGVNDIDNNLYVILIQYYFEMLKISIQLSNFNCQNRGDSL